MGIKLSHCFVSVDDYDKALAFYRDVLGLRVVQDVLMHAIIFATDDCDATFKHIADSGADVLQEPIDQPYGVRDCAFRDPAGNMVRFSQAR